MFLELFFKIAGFKNFNTIKKTNQKILSIKFLNVIWNVILNRY